MLQPAPVSSPPALSRTARVLAARRAVATERGSPLGGDPLAHLFADDELLALARATADEPHYVLMRHRALEDFALAPPVPRQLVLLGAGLDTKFARRPDLRGARVLEVDAADMLAHKAAILRAHGHPVAEAVPAAITGPADLDAVLRITDPALPTAVIAEGFFMYQPEPAALAMLAAICRHYTGGLRLGFDLFDPILADDPEFRRLRAIIEAHGEVFRSFIPPDRVRAHLAPLAADLELRTAEQLLAHYLGGAWTGMRGLYTCTVTTHPGPPAPALRNLRSTDPAS